MSPEFKMWTQKNQGRGYGGGRPAQTSRILPCGCVQALPSGIMKHICPAHVERLRPKPQPVAPPGGKITDGDSREEDI